MQKKCYYLKIGKAKLKEYYENHVRLQEQERNSYRCLPWEKRGEKENLEEIDIKECQKKINKN